MANELGRTDARGESWTARLWSAGRRRVRQWRRLWHDERYPATAQRAGAWLAGVTGSDASWQPGKMWGDAWLAGQVLRASVAFGLDEVAGAASQVLLGRQRADGSLPGAAGESSRSATGQGLVAWLEALVAGEPPVCGGTDRQRVASAFEGAPQPERVPDGRESGTGYVPHQTGSDRALIVAAARRAAEYLFDAMDAAGRVRPVGEGASRSAGGAEATVWLAALFRAGQVLHEPDWQWAAQHAMDRLQRTCDVTAAQGGPERLAQVTEALLDLGRAERAGRALTLARAWQGRGGGLRVARQRGGMSPAEVAHWARLWFQVGQLEPADRAMWWLARQQEADGSWRGAEWPSNDRRTAAGQAGRGSQEGADWGGALAAVAGYLLAARAQVAAHFRAQPETAPAEVSAADPRRRMVRRWLAELPAGWRLADMGCGRGPYVGDAMGRGLRWCGIDALAEHLKTLPLGAERREGSLLRLPLAAGEVDAAMMVESLEHALDAERAVGELCRVLRPGGRLLIVDKDRRRQDLSDHAPWERWFVPSEVADWLRRWCEEVRAVPVTALEGGAERPSGLIAWTAVRGGVEWGRAWRSQGVRLASEAGPGAGMLRRRAA